MNFNSARLVEQIVWQLRLADYPRDLNRARINSLANGDPPYTIEEARKNNVAINVNDLSLTRLSHDARMQLYQAFNKPGNFFTCRTDMGPRHRRQVYGNIVTREVNRIMKRSDAYYECDRSKFAGTVLHGIGPSHWSHQDRWCPDPLGVEDVAIPSNTYLTFRGLPFIAIWKSYTGADLKRMTRDFKHNPGWNEAVVKRAIRWLDAQAAEMWGGTSWAEYWVPSKWQERWKQDSGVYATDLAPTVDVWDFYYWDDVKNHEGWRRRMIFDAEGGYSAWRDPKRFTKARNGKWERNLDKNLIGGRDQFLYNSGDRVVASKLSEIIHFVFADLSAVEPFRYHSVRGLGFMLYAVCHLQNRLRCSFSAAVFEQLLNYIRVNSADDAERALKIEMANHGIIDQTVHFLAPNERWQPNFPLVEAGLNEYKQIIADNSSSWVQNQNYTRDRVEKTKFQVMAEVNAMQTMVSAGLQQAYRYKASEYREVFRRFMNPNSTDPEVREFRGRCLLRKVPESIMVAEAWDIEPERVLGGGNKTMEMAIAQQLMEWRPAYSPASQQIILRAATLAITDDAAITLDLVPDEPTVSKTRQTAMLAFGAIMGGSLVTFTKDQNALELAETLIGELGLNVQQTVKLGGMATAKEIMGYQNVIKTISGLVAKIAEDKAQKNRAHELAQQTGKLANMVKAFAQRLKQQQKAAQKQNGDGGEAAKIRAQIAGKLLLDKAKAANTRESHAERTAQRQAQFELEQQQAEQRHEQLMRQEAERTGLQVVSERLKTGQQLRRDRLKSLSE